MCLLFIFINSHYKNSAYKIILASNRDEFYHRPTSPAKPKGSDPQIICGEDQKEGREGGTWLGVSSLSKIGSLLNISSAPSASPEGASRGYLVKDFLMNEISPVDYVKKIENSGIIYDKYILILLTYKDNYEACYYDNVENSCACLADGVHGFSNSLMNKPYQKVLNGKKEFEKIIYLFNDTKHKKDLEMALFNFMQDRTKNLPDEVLSQKKKIPKHIIPELSSKFVHIPEINYGTRTTTIILIDYDGKVDYIEKTGTENYSDTTTWLYSEYNISPITSPSKI